MDIHELRGEIDKIDDELVKLFVRRMEIAAQVAAYKKENNLPIFVPARESEKLVDIGEKAGPEKLKKAESLGVKVISEAEFREKILRCAQDDRKKLQ